MSEINGIPKTLWDDVQFMLQETLDEYVPDFITQAVALYVIRAKEEAVSKAIANRTIAHRDAASNDTGFRTRQKSSMKPDDVSQKAWDAAQMLFKAVQDHDIEGREAIARAIMAAKAEEREACAKIIDGRAAEASVSQSAAFERGNDVAGNMYWSAHTAALELAQLIRSRT